MIKKEIKSGIIPDPNAAVDPQTGLPLEQGADGMDLGTPVMEPNADGVKDGGSTEVNGTDADLDTTQTKIPKGGTI